MSRETESGLLVVDNGVIEPVPADVMVEEIDAEGIRKAEVQKAIEKDMADVSLTVARTIETVTREKIAEMEHIIAGVEERRSSIGDALIAFSYQNPGASFVVAFVAMREIFNRHGVLNGYYHDAPEMTRYRETNDGWILFLRRPGSNGEFKVVYEEPKSHKVDKQKVTYKFAA